MEIYELSALELGRKIKEREISVAEAVQASLEQIQKKEPQYHCYLTIDEEGAKKRSAAVQKQIEDVYKRQCMDWVMIMFMWIVRRRC